MAEARMAEVRRAEVRMAEARMADFCAEACSVVSLRRVGPQPES